MGGVAGIAPDYDWYVANYHGSMDEAAFGAALMDAVAEVGYAVAPRADLAPHEAEVKMAVCSVADAIGSPEKRRTSYTAGKVSEAYGDPGYSLTAEAAIRRWLAGTGLLKRGRWI